jgi:energy-converting hydrogenase A subunit K
MEEQEKDTLFLMGLAAFGAVLASSLAVYLQWIVVLPLTVALVLIMILTSQLYKKRAIHFSENAEKWVMIITIICFIFAFVYLYRPV